MKSFYGQLYKRKDGKYGWRVRSSHNNKIVATDACQGYSRAVDCSYMFHELFPGMELVRL